MALVEEVKAYLDAQGVTGGATGWQAKTGGFTPEQDRQVLITASPGAPPEAGTDLEYPNFQIMARAEAHEHVAVRAKMDEVMGLFQATSPTMGGKAYIGILATQSIASLLLVDENDRCIYVQNFRTFRSRS